MAIDAFALGLVKKDIDVKKAVRRWRTRTRMTMKKKRPSWILLRAVRVSALAKNAAKAVAPKKALELHPLLRELNDTRNRVVAAKAELAALDALEADALLRDVNEGMDRYAEEIAAEAAVEKAVEAMGFDAFARDLKETIDEMAAADDAAAAAVESVRSDDSIARDHKKEEADEMEAAAGHAAAAATADEEGAMEFGALDGGELKEKTAPAYVTVTFRDSSKMKFFTCDLNDIVDDSQTQGV